MPADALALLILLGAITPGWCAVAGWYWRCRRRWPIALGEWLPGASALGTVWSGMLALSIGPTALHAFAASGPVGKLVLWLGAALMLYALPLGGGWLAARTCSSTRPGRPLRITAVLLDGTLVTGSASPTSERSSLRLTDVVVDPANGTGIPFKGAALTVQRDQIRWTMETRANGEPAQPAD